MCYFTILFSNSCIKISIFSLKKLLLLRKGTLLDNAVFLCNNRKKQENCLIFRAFQGEENEQKPL